MEKPKRILISRIDKIGDVVLSTPVIENVRKAYPDAYIAFMCRPITKDIVNGNPYLDEVIVYDKDGRHKNFLKTLFFSLELTRKNFDLAIVLHPSNRSHWIPFLAGIPNRVGWDKKCSWLLTKKIPHNKQDGAKHESEYNLDLLRAIDIPVISSNLYFPINRSDINRVEDILSEFNIKLADPFIVIHPSASCPSKHWPQEYFVDLIGRLSAFGKVIVVTAKNDAYCGDKIVKNARVVDLRGRFTVAQTGCLLKYAKLLVCNDSGPMHIGGAVGVPLIAIFGRSNPGLGPSRWRPLGKDSHYIFKDSGCRPCYAHNCLLGFRCLKMISPDEVFVLAKQILNKKDCCEQEK